MKIKTSELILDNFKEFWLESGRDKYLYYVLKGGRNSGKSVHISLDRILYTAKNPVNGLAIRKHATYLRESVFEQLKWAARQLGLEQYFTFQKSPMQVIYKPRGNKILLTGADEPDRIKSIVSSQFPYTWMWVEELAEFKTEEEVEILVDSIVREETDYPYKVFFSYNPPKRKSSWCNKKFNSVTLPEIYYVHHSDYRDNKYVSGQALQNIEITKEENEYKYRHTWLGEPIGSGLVPFDNLTFRPITDDEIKTFDNIRQGIDWGYSVDPFCFGRMHYDKKHKKLYIIDEIYGVKLSNRVAAEKIIEKGYNDVKIIAGSDEPKSISEICEYGVRCVKADTGPGSVEFGEKWLDDLNEIVIDPKRTPNISREYENIDYKQSKDGSILGKLDDENNHSIDMTRYAVSDDMVKKSFFVGRA